jgi:uncharacterized repeat protein (TIGR02543 family)
MKSLLRYVLLSSACLALVSCGNGTPTSSASLSPSTSEGGSQDTRWDTTFKVTFNLNYEGATEPYQVVDVVGNTAVSKPADPTRKGYSFFGWYLDTYAVTAFDFAEKITAATDLYAGWIEGGTSSSSDSSSSSSTTSSATSTGSNLICFKDTTWWAKDGACTNIYFFSGSTAGPVAWPGVKMNSVGSSSDGHGIFMLDITDYATYTDIVFCRTNPTGVTDWGAKTVNISLADRLSNNMYDVSSVTAESWGDPGITGVWTSYNA